jgi:hypothetical protein
VNGVTNRASSEMDWAALMSRPVAYIDTTRLAACFEGHIGIGLCERLRNAGRLQDRLSTIIRDFYALASPISPDAVSPADQKVALLSSDKTRDLIHRAGAAYWANAIANAVQAEEVRRLRDRLGEPLYAFALANRHLSGAAGKLDLTDGMDVRIAEDGMRCFGAWCASQPDAIAGRVRLKRPASPILDDNADDHFKKVGPAIICHVAS